MHTTNSRVSTDSLAPDTAAAGIPARGAEAPERIRLPGNPPDTADHRTPGFDIADPDPDTAADPEQDIEAAVPAGGTAAHFARDNWAPGEPGLNMQGQLLEPEPRFR